MIPQLTPALTMKPFDVTKPLPEPSAPIGTYLPILPTIFPQALVAKGPAEKTRLQSPISAMLQVPLSNSQKNALRKRLGKSSSKYIEIDLVFVEESKKVTSIAEFVLTHAELRGNYYPMAESSEDQLPPGWVQTQPAHPLDDSAHDLLAMDCEMVGSLLPDLFILDFRHSSAQQSMGLKLLVFPSWTGT